jgi:hypothetical protein
VFGRIDISKAIWSLVTILQYVTPGLFTLWDPGSFLGITIIVYQNKDTAPKESNRPGSFGGEKLSFERYRLKAGMTLVKARCKIQIIGNSLKAYSLLP